MSTELMRRPHDITAVLKQDQSGWVVSKVRVSEELQKAADSAIALASGVVKVEDDATLCEAMDALGYVIDAHGHLEEARKRVKAPFASAVKMIDAAPKPFTERLERERDRLKLLVSNFEGERIRAAKLEQARLEQESRRLSELAFRSSDPDHIEALQELAAEKAVEAVASRPVQNGRSVIPTYTATLKDFVKIANSNPQLLKQELNTAAVNDLIRVLSDGGRKAIAPDAIPGIILSPSAVVRVRR